MDNFCPAGLVGDLNTPPVVVHIASSVGLPLSEPTIGKAFAAAGYDTHFTGEVFCILQVNYYLFLSKVFYR